MSAAQVRRKARRKRRVAAAQRDQHESAFATILSMLVARVPGARGAALVDSEGETVDYAGRAKPFDVKVAAAHWRIVLDEARATAGLGALGDLRSIAVRAARASYLVQTLPDGYALVVVMMRSAGFSGWQRAVASCAHSLGEEAGWKQGATELPPRWFPVTVLRDERRRPAAVRSDGRLHPLEILGTLPAGLSRRERAWRIRFESGLEATLVREPGGACYLDEKLGPEQMR
jgi:predicted regulator of Ras-like GTPase activity (Roadblock/LC7/MglB family)